MMSNKRSIVITSMDVITPSFDEFLPKESKFHDMSEFFDLNNHRICEIKSTTTQSRDAKIMTKPAIMLNKSVDSVFSKSRLHEYNPEEIGLFMSLGMFDYDIDDLLPAVLKSMKDETLYYTDFFKKGFREIYPLWPLTMLNNIAMCQCSIKLGIRGDNAVFSPHSDSSLNAIYEGWMSVQQGNCNVAIVGGVSEIVSPMSLIRYVLCNTNSSRINKLSTIPPYFISEGAVVFSLEDIDDARNRGLTCLSILKGFGASFEFDEKKGGATVDSIETSMKSAMQMADIQPQDIDCVFCHHDIEIDEGENELKALKKTFSKLPTVICSKSRFGDMLSCAGAFDVSLGIMMLLDEDYAQKITNKRQTYMPSNILINAMSVEGSVSTLIIGRIQ